MVEPFGEHSLGNNIIDLGEATKIEYINDFGGLVEITFQCNGNRCIVSGDNKKR